MVHRVRAHQPAVAIPAEGGLENSGVAGTGKYLILLKNCLIPAVSRYLSPL